MRRLFKYSLWSLASFVSAGVIFVLLVLADSSDRLARWYLEPGVVANRILAEQIPRYSYWLAWLDRAGGNSVVLGMPLGTHFVFGIPFLYAFIFWACVIMATCILLYRAFAKGLSMRSDNTIERDARRPPAHLSTENRQSNHEH